MPEASGKGTSSSSPMDADGEAVLHFLLGKTAAVALEDTRSVTSTSSSQASDATSAGSGRSAFHYEDEPEDNKGAEGLDGAVPGGDGRPLELRTISEAGSEQELEEEEEEEEEETDHESTDGEQQDGAGAVAVEEEDLREEDGPRRQNDQGRAAAPDATAETPSTENDDAERDGSMDTGAGTKSEVESEDGCGQMDEQDNGSADRELSVASPGRHYVSTSSDEGEDESKVSKPSHATSPPPLAVTTIDAGEPPVLQTPTGAPSVLELALVNVIAIALLAYVAACAVSYLSRDVTNAVVLPDASQFEHPVDLSNVSVHIVGPANHSAISAPLLRLDWRLDNFPADALRAWGPEVYRYDVSVNDQLISSDVAVLSLSPSEKEDERVTGVSRPATQFIRWDTLDTLAEAFTVRIDVQVTTPGAFDHATTLSESLALVNAKYAVRAVDDGAVEIQTPADGERVPLDEDVVLTYVAGASVARLRVTVDGAFVAWKTHVGDGVLLLHGLADGAHEVTLEAIGDASEDAESSATVRVLIGPS